MPDFSELFHKSEGQPVEYKNNMIRLVDYIPVKDGDTFLLTFESTHSEWEQGVFLGFKTNKNSIVVENHHFPRGGYLWYNNSPKEVPISLHLSGKNEPLLVYNSWKGRDNVINSWYYGAAMIREDIPNGARYRCNDGHPDDNFDDIIFTLVKTKGVWEPPLEKSPYLKD